MNNTTTRFSREEAAGYKPKIIGGTHVVLVGAGALGQFVAMLLALIGYPRVTIIDMGSFDDDSNISRSPFWRRGWEKAKAVTLGARKHCTATKNVSYSYSTCMVQELGDAIFQGENVIVLAAVDSDETRRWLAHRCRLLGIPLVEGGFHAERGNLSVFRNYNNDPCWACDREDVQTSTVFSCDVYARQSEAQGFIPATAPGAMSLASLQVAIATSYLHGEPTLVNSTVFTDLRNGTSRIMRRSCNPNCSLNHSVVKDNAVKVKCSHEHTVGQLIEGVESLVPDPLIKLPASFILAAPCVECHHPVLIHKPEWAVQEPVKCKECGGEFVQSDKVPEQHGILSRQTSKEIGEMPLSKIGVGPGLHLFVEGSSENVVVALSGNADEFLTSV